MTHHSHPLIPNQTPRSADLRYLSLTLCISICTSVGCQHHSEPKREQIEKSYDLELPNIKADGPFYRDPDFELEVGRPEVCATHGVLAPPPELERIVIPARIQAVSAHGVPVGPMLFSLEIGKKLVRPTLASCKAPFAPSTLESKASLNVHIAFDIPKDSKEGELIFEPFIIGRKRIHARVQLPPVSR